MNAHAEHPATSQPHASVIRLLGLCLAAISAAALVACGKPADSISTLGLGEPPPAASNPSPGAQVAPAPAVAQAPAPPSATTPVAAPDRGAIFDRGFNMKRGSYWVPEDWALTHDVAHDPTTGKRLRWEVEFKGPGGAFIRSLGTASYYARTQSFEQTWQQLARDGLQGRVQNLEFGELGASESLASVEAVQQQGRRAAGEGHLLQALEAQISGRLINGAPYRGMVQFTHLTSASAPGEFGFINATVLAGPPERLIHTMMLKQGIDESFKSDPAFDARMAPLIARMKQNEAAKGQARIARSAAEHRQRMAARNAAFNAHQRKMGAMSAAQDANHAAWMRNNAAGSTVGGGAGAGGTNAFIDQIHERTAFDDPDTGQVIHKDGQFDHNFQNGLGDYHRTNDPSFDPAALQGDWQRIDPL